MKISNFSVNNYKGITGGLENNKISFKDSNTIFLFGQNNVGKSTFLKAYEVFYYNKAISGDDFYKKDPEHTIEFELEVEFDISDFDKVEQVAPKKTDSLKKYLREGKFLKVKRTIGGTRQKDTVKPSEPVNFTYNPESDTWDDSNYGSIGLETVFQKLLPTPIFIKAMPTETELEDIVNTILTEKAKKVLGSKDLAEFNAAKAKITELQSKMYNPETITKYKAEVNTHFQRVFPDTKIELEDVDNAKFTADKIGKKFKIHFEKIDARGASDNTVPSSYENIGHGAVRTAIFTLLLMQDIADEYLREDGKKDFLVLFEEPELFLHPKLMRELRDLIYRVSEDNYPYQLLCASHSPQMIDLAKQKSSLVRMVNVQDVGTRLYQIDRVFLKYAAEASSNEELKQELYEVLRFNPHICESFYSDEVLLVEGPTEEIIALGFLEIERPNKHVFIVNCASVNNIPFYQRIFSKFAIKYHVICDSDDAEMGGLDDLGLIVFNSGIQKSIYEQFKRDAENVFNKKHGLFRIHTPTFEPAHQEQIEAKELAMPKSTSLGKPMDANNYWRNQISQNLSHPKIQQVFIIKYLKEIIMN